MTPEQQIQSWTMKPILKNQKLPEQCKNKSGSAAVWVSEVELKTLTIQIIFHKSLNLELYFLYEPSVVKAHKHGH